MQKRYLHHTEELLSAHPEFLDRSSPSLDARLDIVKTAVPELAAQACRKAIAEWGRPAADITHLVFATNSGAHMPGADLRLASLLGLRPSAQRTEMYLTGCHAGSAALRVAKDVAENSRGARVLVACGDLSLVKFRAPHEDRPETLVLQALFGDGAGAAIVGAASDEMYGSGAESCPLFEMVSASQTVVPNSEDAVAGQLGQDGLVFSPSPRMPALVREHIERCLADAVGPLGLLGGGGGDWNDLFWAVHPGGPAILDSVQATLALAPSKLAASRHVLSEYGNMSGASVIFVLDELRRRRGMLDGDFGVMLGFGPGFTVETMVLRAAKAATKKVF